MSQLVLPLHLQDHAVFDSFYPAGNETLFGFLTEMSSGPGCFIWGPPASGRTHLLQAVCARAGDDSAYLPLAHFQDAGAAVLEGLAERRFVCLDDLQQVAGKPEWEAALFELSNQLLDADRVLVVSSSAPPRESNIQLADLTSRFSRLPVFHCVELAEKDRIRALQLRARHRGLELPGETAKFLLARSRRDMASLYGLLDKLDKEAMIAKRRLTIPFVRDILGKGQL